MNLLLPPFKTRCRHYLADGYTSQRDCFHSCLLRWSLAYHEPIPFRVPYTKHDDDRRFETMDEFLKNKTRHVDTCAAECRQMACQIVSYKSITMAQSSLNGFAMTLMLPIEPDIVINYKPKLVMTEFIALLASTVGLWLGFSVYSLMSYFQEFLLATVYRK